MLARQVSSIEEWKIPVARRAASVAKSRQEHIEHHLTSGDASGNTTGPQDELRTSTGRRPIGEERDGVQTETASKLMKSQRNLARQIELLDQKVNLPPSSLLLPGAKVSAPSPVQVLLRDWLLPPHPLTG